MRWRDWLGVLLLQLFVTVLILLVQGGGTQPVITRAVTWFYAHPDSLRPVVHASSLQLAERANGAPGAIVNAVQIYAEDNGAGKTRLLVRFGTGAVQQLSIEP